MEVLRTDVAIIGGGLGACAAALAAARLGRRVILTEETHWIGGQLTNQAVPPDEQPWIESYGATATYRALRDGIRAYYRTHTPLTPEARSDAHLNPGGGWVSRLCHDPRIAVAVLHQMMIPHQLAPFFIDATPYGDLLDLAGVEHVLGAEARSQTGEPARRRASRSVGSAGDHGLLRDRASHRGGPHHR